MNLKGKRPPDPQERLAELHRHVVRANGDTDAIKRVLDAYVRDRPERVRHADAFRLYFGLSGRPPMTLDVISNEFKLSRERIRQMKAQMLATVAHPSRWDPEWWKNRFPNA